ncbi:MAG: glucose-6-phosphate isomerase [Chromatiales bacterium]|nr:glucose-6-phosphate isomerase [Chromatiales bacterium]
MTDLDQLVRQTSGMRQGAAWKALAARAAALPADWPARLLDAPGRFAACSREAAGLLLDFSRHPVDDTTLGLLVDLATERHLPGWIEALFDGAPVNTTEGRPALHMALRSPLDGFGHFGLSREVQEEVLAERARMLVFAEAVRRGERQGATGKPFRTIVNIGIGGSDLGLVMATEALAPRLQPGLDFRFVSNIDGSQLADVMATADPATTLFIICSKSFSTLETALNADTARRWIIDQLGEAAIARHFVAVSTNAAAMDRFGLAPDARFRIWDWVGGRYSMWSAIGLALAIGLGGHGFREFLAGGERLDRHFRTAPLRDNLPVLLGLLAVWNQDFLGAETHAVLPYDGRLHRFAAYLQQLEMESNGKGVTHTGDPVAGPTGAILWGEPGSNAQHSFFQLLHQGTRRFTADFIAPANGSSRLAAQHLEGLANMLAQAEAFVRGHGPDEVRAELAGRGLAPALQERLVPHRVHPGGHASSILLCRELDPAALGALVALYEHKVFVQAVVWGINPFDQWGVELGKRLAVPMHAALTGEGDARLPGAGEVIRAWRR